MASLDAFFPALLGFEGGFVNDPDDPGGATNKGITLRTFGPGAALLGIQPTLENLKALTNDQARRIYKAFYWDKIQGDQIGQQELANIVFDFYVNAGANATKLLQSVLNDMGASPELPVDGLIGPVTLQAIQRADQNELYRRYKQGRMDYYQDLVANHPSLGKFLRGWLNRVNAFPDL
ncbi:MAG TPA: glycosyl hydrolase 108 family protein [Steroidobacteraceae bacterium]|nr:glycosyl hydrolase 108 family protein [Steroidobacteraceae bacterium]